MFENWQCATTAYSELISQRSFSFPVCVALALIKRIHTKPTHRDISEHERVRDGVVGTQNDITFALAVALFANK